MRRGKCVGCGEIVAEMGMEFKPGKHLVSMESLSDQCPRSSAADGLHHLSEEENMTEQKTDERPEITGGAAVMPGGTVHEGGIPTPVEEHQTQGGAVGPWGNPGLPGIPAGVDPSVVESIVQQTLGSLMGQMGGPQTFEDALGEVDPRDSEAALQMLDWLLRNKRLNRVGTLDGGQGYLFVYQEPKGSSKEGYAPGGTQGDRIVDQAVEKQRESGVAPKGKSTMCRKCYSAVVVQEDGTSVSDDAAASAKCSADGGAHDPA